MHACNSSLADSVSTPATLLEGMHHGGHSVIMKLEETCLIRGCILSLPGHLSGHSVHRNSHVLPDQMLEQPPEAAMDVRQL